MANAFKARPCPALLCKQRPRYLLSGKMTCVACGASYAKSGKSRFGCQLPAKKRPTWCDNRLTIRQGALDARVLAELTTERLRKDIVGAFPLTPEYDYFTINLRS